MIIDPVTDDALFGSGIIYAILAGLGVVVYIIWRQPRSMLQQIVLNICGGFFTWLFLCVILYTMLPSLGALGGFAITVYLIVGTLLVLCVLSFRIGYILVKHFRRG